MRRIHVYLDDSEVDDSEVDDSLRLMYEGEPFTGELVNTYGETLTFLETYRNGWPDGPRREWYHDGTLKAEGMARHSVAIGTHRKCTTTERWPWRRCSPTTAA